MTFEPSLSSLKSFMTTPVPYWRTLGMKLKEIEPGKAVFDGVVRPDLLQNKVLHGGVRASIADSACAVAAISLVVPASDATTINLQLSYLKKVTEGRFRADCECLNAGKNVMFCDAQVFDQNQALVCIATSQLLVIPAE